MQRKPMSNIKGKEQSMNIYTQRSKALRQAFFVRRNKQMNPIKVYNKAAHMFSTPLKTQPTHWYMPARWYRSRGKNEIQE